MTQPQSPLPGPVYAAALGKATKPVTKLVRTLFLTYGVPVTPEALQQMAMLLIRSLRNARKRTYNLGVQHIRDSGYTGSIPQEQTYPLPALTQLLVDAAARTYVAGKAFTAEQKDDPLAVHTAANVAAGAVSRHAQQPARDVVKAAADTSDAIGWARQLTGPTSCGFCAMLVSRGPIYASERAALFKGGSAADEYHDDCDCIAVLVTDFDTWPGRQSYERLEDLWLMTGGRHSGTDARNAFRRAWDGQVNSGGSKHFTTDAPDLEFPNESPAGDSSATAWVDARIKNRRHILAGDSEGGGHRFGANRPGETEYPPLWSDYKILSAISHTIDNGVDGPIRSGVVNRYGLVDGVRVQVRLDGKGQFIGGGWPIDGDGVVRTSKKGDRHYPLPLGTRADVPLAHG